MGWISGLVILCQVTSFTGVWRVGIFSLMASSTVIRNLGMCTIELIEIIVIWKGGWIPIRCRSMAGCTVC